MEGSTPYLITQIVIAISMVLVCILSIWGDRIRSYIAGPKLEFELPSPQGYPVERQSGTRTIYWHVRIKNNRHWKPARRVRILCDSISRKPLSRDRFVQELSTIPVQLTWAFQEFHEILPTIVKENMCDLGYIDEGAQQFKLSVYRCPHNFRGFISANETMQVSLIATADNFTSKSPYVLEISWDGKWSPYLEDMQKHLVIKEV